MLAHLLAPLNVVLFRLGNAQFLLNAKKIENWAFWIAADLVYVPLYAVKRLDLTALVYLLFPRLYAAG